MLEVGCGNGKLSLALDSAGYDVTAIDPAAPAGPIFRPIKLEELEDDARFDAVVASGVFHHMGESLEPNLDRVARALEGGGPFVLDEFGPDRLDEVTEAWYEGQRLILAAAGRPSDRPSADQWAQHHFSVTPSDVLLAAVRSRFDEQVSEDVPYLWRYLGGIASAELEESLVSMGAIKALGFRFVGMPRADRAFQPL
ncbi:MAG TPA: methyltransferase domain-containing protein [Gaiellaceae bacterium]|nr:methyltransferase domain-containing protein [Gaiellaceae bacterium]